MTAPIIFLDIDGVLVTLNSMKRYGNGQPDPSCVEALNEIIRETAAKIVVSSTWRLLYGVDGVAKYLDSWGVEGEVIGATPCPTRDGRNGLLIACTRGEEIAAYLSGLEERPPMVILDDDSDMGELIPYLVRTNFEHGLDGRDMETAIALLNEQKEGENDSIT